jgi:SpoIID/LytB domain protein
VKTALALAAVGLLATAGLRSSTATAIGAGSPRIAGAVPTAATPIAAAQDPGAIIALPTTLRVGIAHGASYDVTALPLETYVARVLAGEAAASSPPAALEALAITVRTFALENAGRHRADGFDLCDQTHCQVLRAATSATERAAQATAGQVLVYRGALATVFYSASCGGFTASPSSVWPGADDPPYLPSRKDDACEGEPAWVDDISRLDLSRAFAAAGFHGVLRDIRVVSRDGSGRVARLAVDGLNPAEISGQDLRTAVIRTLGPLHVKSAAFDLRRAGESYHFSGHGYGHGVGMCVMGSVKLAATGESAATILGRYFPGTTITAPTPRTTTLAPPARRLPAVRAPVPAAAAAAGAIVSLPEGDEGEEGALLALVAGARNDLAKSLAIAPPARVTLRFHSTTAEYERATGQSWFTSASIVGQEIHFVPLASLRDRGVLDRTVRRELVHAMVDGVLAQRPAWVREGAALYFSDARREDAPQGRTQCPADGELLSPLSAGALADAYARARSCFVRQLASGRSWRDVR